jgi:UDP-glucose 4-epimerase
VEEIVAMMLKKNEHKGVVVSYTGDIRWWPGDIPRIRLDTRKLEDLGWKAKYTSDHAVAKAIDDMLSSSARGAVPKLACLC